VRRLAFEGGFRQSWYENPESKFSSRAYKLALDLTSVPGFRVRASQQRAIRAPNVLELLAPPQPDSFLRDPCAGTSPAASETECALTGVTSAQYGNIANFNGLFEYNAIIGGNEDLRPETATTHTIGIVLQPRFLRGFNGTIDWWDIKLKGAISRIGAQAVADSMFYSGADSVFQLFTDPIAWANNSQITGDTMYLYTKNKKPKRLYVFENGFAVNKVGKDMYNQLRGNRVNGYFKEGNIDYIRSKGNAQSVFYVMDKDSALVGINKAEGDIIDLRFVNKELNKVVVISEPKATMFPAKQASEQDKVLRNFRWLEARRPKTKYELFGN